MAESPSKKSKVARPLVIKGGTETPHPVTGIEFPIPNVVERLKSVADVVVTEDEQEETLLKAIPGATALIITYGAVTKRVLEAGQPTLKAICVAATGVDSVDIDAAKKLGVRVVNCCDYAAHSVAECAFLLIINVMKKFVTINKGVRADGWVAPIESIKSWELHGKMVGMIGLGHINSTLVTMCKGFGMRLQAYDPYLEAEAMRSQGVEKLDKLDDLMASSDVVCICVPLNQETTKMVSERHLRLMKRSAFFINVGRGACVDEGALLRVLREGAIAGCGLDVIADEPLLKEGHELSEFVGMDNVVITPHVASWCYETWDRLETEVEQNVLNVLNGKNLVIHSKDPRLLGQAGCEYK